MTAFADPHSSLNLMGQRAYIQRRALHGLAKKISKQVIRSTQPSSWLCFQCCYFFKKYSCLLFYIVIFVSCFFKTTNCFCKFWLDKAVYKYVNQSIRQLISLAKMSPNLTGRNIPKVPASRLSQSCSLSSLQQEKGMFSVFCTPASNLSFVNSK